MASYLRPWSVLMTILIVTSASFSQTWDGGNATNNWHDAGNWSPDGVPTSTGIAILDASLATATSIVLSSDVQFGLLGGLDGLTIADGFDLDTNGFALHVDDALELALTDITGSGSSLVVQPLASNPAGTAFRTDQLTVRSSGLFSLRGGNARVDTLANVRENGRIQGYGTMELGSPSSAGIALDNRGTISVSLPPLAVVGSLRLSTAANAPAGTTLSLSGSTGTGRLTVNNGPTSGALSLIVDAETEDFEGVLDIGQADSAEFVHDLTLFGGTVEFNGGLGVATLKGAGSLGNLGGTLAVNSGTGRIENTVSLGIASLVDVAPGTHLVFANNVTASSSATIDVGAGATIEFAGGSNTIAATGVDFLLGDDSQLLVRGDLTIDAGNTAGFDWDGSAESADTVVDGPTAALRLKGGLIDPAVNGHEAGVTIQNGGLVVVDIDPAVSLQWLKQGTLSMESQAGAPSSTLRTTAGTMALFRNAVIDVSGTGVSIIDGDANVFQAGSDVTVTPDATLRIHSATLAEPMTWGDGNGTLQTATELNVQANSTLNFSAVDLDGPNGTASITVNDKLNLIVDRISQNASNVFGQFNQNPTESLLVIGSAGRLDVQFNDPATFWTIGELAQVDLFGNVASEHISGSDVVIQGDVHVIAGNSRWTARMNLQQTTAGNALITIDAGNSLSLEGGTLANPNRLEGGEIVGDGELRSIANRALHGYGRIDADINFAGGNSTLFAADQDLLVVNGDIVSVGRIGTANAGGTLQFGSTFDTSVASVGLELHGGTVVGAGIINDGTTLGFGTVRSQQFSQNGTGLILATGGALVIDPIDPTINVTQGTLNASNGDLSLAKPLSSDFQGVANVGAARKLSFAGETRFTGTGQLNLSGGPLAITQAMVAGDVQVGSNAVVNVTGHGGFADQVTFGERATVNLPTATDILHLAGDADIPFHNNNTARFIGGGRLQNEVASTLNIAGGVTIGADVNNRGALSIDSSNTGTIAVDADFVQLNTAVLEIDLAGAGQHDLLNVSGTVNLAGALDVALDASYSPLVGESLPVIASGLGITGQFDTTHLPSLVGAIALNVAYEPDQVLINVVSLPDFNVDGVLDCADIDSLVGEIAAGTNNVSFDMTGDGNVDEADLNQWLQDAGAVNLPSGNSYLVGDGNLDGVVDGSDFGIWNANKFTATASWCSGDFNADGVVDGSDFGAWNANKFTSANNVQAVPEPAGVGILLATIGFVLVNCRRR